MIPTESYKVTLCDCWDGERVRGKVTPLYTRDDDGWIRCEKCGNIPNEIPNPTDLAHAVEITVISRDMGRHWTCREVKIHPETMTEKRYQIELTEEQCTVISEALAFVDNRESVTTRESQRLNKVNIEFSRKWANAEPLE